MVDPAPSIEDAPSRSDASPSWGPTATCSWSAARPASPIAVAARLDQLEARWSRFRPTSELSQLNAAAGEPRLVSADTVVLVDALRQGWELTGGRFDPTVADAMCDLGYVASWPDVASPLRLPPARPTVGCGGIDLNAGRGLVRLPRGCTSTPAAWARAWPLTSSPRSCSTPEPTACWSTWAVTCG